MGAARIRRVWDRFTARRRATTDPRPQYRFLVRNWTSINDADVAARVLATEYFSNELEPVALPAEEVRSFLVLAPHQDDEVIGAGGTLLLAAARGAAIHIVFTTDGEQNEQEDTRSIRDDEALDVCKRLGGTREYLGISNVRLDISMEHVDRLAAIIERVRPEVILAPWLLDAPAKHRMANHLLWLASQRGGAGSGCEVWGYQVHNVLFPNGYVEITPVIDEKRELIRRYKSQIEKYYRYDHTACGMAAWNSRLLPGNKGNPEERYAEVFFALPFSELARLVERYYLPDMQRIYKGKSKIVDEFGRLHRELSRDGRR